MLLIVGLGNPGAKYAKNRHNIGFMAADEIAAAHGFSTWRKKFQAEVAEGRLGSTKALIMKPQTFMNESGRSVGAALRFFDLPPADVVVLHDELDLAPGKLRLKTGGGHAGHNGLRSIDDHIGKDYHRARLGIGHPGDKTKVHRYVLGDFAKADQTWLQDMLRGIADAAPFLGAKDWASFQNKVHLAVHPAKLDQEPRAGDAKAAIRPGARHAKATEPEKLGPFARLKKLLEGND